MNQFLVIVVYGIRICHLILCIDGLVIRSDFDPRCACGESCGCTVIPLHRGSRIVSSAQVQVAHHVIRRYFSGSGQLVEGVDALDVAELGQIVEWNVLHAELITLVYVRSTLHHMKAGSQHFGAYHTVFR